MLSLLVVAAASGGAAAGAAVQCTSAEYRPQYPTFHFFNNLSRSAASNGELVKGSIKHRAVDEPERISSKKIRLDHPPEILISHDWSGYFSHQKGPSSAELPSVPL